MIEPLVEQLWGPAVAAGRLRVHGPDDAPAAGWREVERYYAVPSTSRPTMLLPVGPRPALLGALNNYRGLRTARRQLQRRALGAVVLAGGLPFPQVVLSVPDDDEAPHVHPLGELATALGRDDLRAAIGVRTGANRKATLQLVDVHGNPVGFAKFAWSEQTAVAVHREAQALATELGEGTCRRPALLAEGTWCGRPYLVSAPLPLSCRGARGSTPPPTVQEFHDLAPVTGRRPLATSRHLSALVSRLEDLALDEGSAPLVTRTLRMLDAASATGTDVVMSERWHGDLTPWNAARDADGHLWCWDWESSEADAVAGLDALHWHLSLVQEAGGALDGSALAGAVSAARPVLTGLGHRRESAAVVTAVYVAALVERAVALSQAEGGWEAGWLSREDLEGLVTYASRALPVRD